MSTKLYDMRQDANRQMTLYEYYQGARPETPDCARRARLHTGIATADFLLIRHVVLGRLTLDRLMLIVNRPWSRVEVKARVRGPKQPRTARRRSEGKA